MSPRFSSGSSCRTEDGVFLCFYSDFGLARVRFPDAMFESELKGIDQSGEVRVEWRESTHGVIRRILRGESVGPLPPLDLHGTDFQRQVWAALLTIPLGETRTYGEIAEQIGNPDSVRAVGRACGANPIPLIVPCHRVLAAGNRLGGFSGGQGWKPRLLEREGWTAGSDLPLFQDGNQSDPP